MNPPATTDNHHSAHTRASALTTVEQIREAGATLPLTHPALPNAAGAFNPPLSPATAYQLARAGKFPGAVQVGSRWFVRTGVLLDVLGVGDGGE